MSEYELKKILKPLGFSNKRSKWFKEIASNIEDVPSDKDELLKLPGVADYTSNAVLCFGFGKRYPVYDVNVKRVFNSAFSDCQNHTDMSWRLLPDNKVREYNFGLIDLGSELKKEEITLVDLLER